MENNNNREQTEEDNRSRRRYMMHDNSHSTPNYLIHNHECSNPMPNLRPSYYANSPRHFHPQWTQYTNYGQHFPIPTNFIVRHFYPVSLNHHIGYPCNNPFNNTQIQWFHSNTVLPYQFHNDANRNLFNQSPVYVNYYPNYMSAGIAPDYYQQPVEHLWVPLTPPIIRPVHFIPTPYRALNRVRQSGSQTNYNNEIFSPRPRIHNSSARQLHGSGNINPTRSRPIPNPVYTINPPGSMQFGSCNPSEWTHFCSLNDYNDELLSPHPRIDSSIRQLLGSDDLPNWSHERTSHSYSRSYNNRSQNRNELYGQDQSSARNEILTIPDYIESDSLGEQPCEVGQNCDICKADLSVDVMNDDDRFLCDSLPETAVLPCHHAFHITCLELHTDREAYLFEPPCPSCVPTSQTLAEH